LFRRNCIHFQETCKWLTFSSDEKDTKKSDWKNSKWTNWGLAVKNYFVTAFLYLVSLTKIFWLKKVRHLRLFKICMLRHKWRRAIFVSRSICAQNSFCWLLQTWNEEKHLKQVLIKTIVTDLSTSTYGLSWLYSLLLDKYSEDRPEKFSDTGTFWIQVVNNFV
jgi:hypothetical protein